MAAPSYPPEMTKPMEEELTRLGVEALHTPEEVDKVLGDKEKTVLVVVNSVCGCAAGQARPGVALAMTNDKKPDHIVTVFAGVDREAVAQARSYFKGYAPSSPQMALLKDGEVVFMLERGHVENGTANMIGDALSKAFNEHC
jgi:putative YphP/YqiW family bacilliredoxin